MRLWDSMALIRFLRLNKMECPFCFVIKEISEPIYEGKEVYVMLSNPRVVPGHTLIIPRRHIEKPAELTSSERKELFDTVILFQEKIISKISSGCDVRENYRPFVPQSRLKIDHIHFHLIPRELNDDLYKSHYEFQIDFFHDLEDTEKESISKLLS